MGLSATFIFKLTALSSSEQKVELIKKLSVFNRWGAVIFEGNDLESSVDTQGWDGTFNGKTVNTDVYIWMAEIQFLDGEVISYSGDLTVTK